MKTKWKFNRGGRGGKKPLDDCAIRAIAIHQGWSYQHTTDIVNEVSNTDVRDGGMELKRLASVMSAIGLARIEFATDTPVMLIAQRLRDCVIQVIDHEVEGSNDCLHAHIMAVIDGNIHDEWDSRFYSRHEDIINTARTAWISPVPIQRRKRANGNKSR